MASEPLLGPPGATTRRLVVAALACALVASVVNLLIASTARGLFTFPSSFIALRTANVVVLTTLGAIAATAVYGWLARKGGDVVPRFRRIAVVVLLLSFLPDLALFAAPGTTGATGRGVAVLMTLHVVTFLVIVGVLTGTPLLGEGPGTMEQGDAGPPAGPSGPGPEDPESLYGG